MERNALMNNDLISRSALKKALKSNCDLCHDKNTNWCEHCCPLNDFEDLIDNAPTVELDESVIQEVLNKRCMTAITNEYFIALHGKRPQGEYIEKYKKILQIVEHWNDKSSSFVSACEAFEKILDVTKGGAE